MSAHLTSDPVTAAATAPAPRRRGYVVAGVIAGVAAAALTLGLAAAAGAAGVTFELPDGGESIPWLAFPQMVLIGTVLGLLLAAALRRWAARPARSFVRITVVLTALSLVPPFLVGGSAATCVCLVVLHLVAAAVVIPAIAGRLSR
jgi:hypothetical protein